MRRFLPQHTINPESKFSLEKISYYVSNPKFGLYKANAEDAGYDICSRESYIIEPMDRVLVKTGLFMQLPFGWEMQIRPRSGLALKYGVTVLNAPGTIDCGYVDEIGVILANFGKDTFEIKPGDRIAQAVFNKLSHCEPSFDLKEPPPKYTTRDGGFGSSGK